MPVNVFTVSCITKKEPYRINGLKRIICLLMPFYQHWRCFPEMRIECLKRMPDMQKPYNTVGKAILGFKPDAGGH